MKAAVRFALSSAASILCPSLTSAAVQKALFNAVRLNRPEISGLLSRSDIAFLCYCLARRANSRSQIMQDLWVCYELGEMRGGYFVEFGATDGLRNSNTWLLEKQYDWNGILAEPNPLWFSALSANRSATIDRRCVHSESGKMLSFITTDQIDPELSGIADFSTSDHFAELRSRGKAIQVETISLGDLLDECQAPQEIDYLSVDTEGSEYEILSKFHFGSRRFKLISVEKDSTTEPALQALLHANGYVRVFSQFSQWDAWYVSEHLRRHRKIDVTAPAS